MIKKLSLGILLLLPLIPPLCHYYFAVYPQSTMETEQEAKSLEIPMYSAEQNTNSNPVPLENFAPVENLVPEPETAPKSELPVIDTKEILVSVGRNLNDSDAGSISNVLVSNITEAIDIAPGVLRKQITKELRLQNISKLHIIQQESESIWHRVIKFDYDSNFDLANVRSVYTLISDAPESIDGNLYIAVIQTKTGETSTEIAQGVHSISEQNIFEYLRKLSQ